MRRLVPLVLFLVVWVPAAHAWTWPAPGPVVQGFSYDAAHPYAGGQHRGVDIRADANTTVLAPAAGTVSFAGSVPGSGRTVTIETADGFAVTLTHLGTITVAKGAGVAEGEPVGSVGPSGTPEVDGPYVHLGIRTIGDENGYLDPLALLPAAPAGKPTADAAPASAPAAPPAAETPPAAAPSPAPAPAPAAPAPAPAPTPAAAPAPAPAPVPAAAPAPAAVPAATAVRSPAPPADAASLEPLLASPPGPAAVAAPDAGLLRPATAVRDRRQNRRATPAADGRPDGADAQGATRRDRSAGGEPAASSGSNARRAARSARGLHATPASRIRPRRVPIRMSAAASPAAALRRPLPVWPVSPAVDAGRHPFDASLGAVLAALGCALGLVVLLVVRQRERCRPEPRPDEEAAVIRLPVPARAPDGDRERLAA